MPASAREGDAGLDLYAAATVTLAPGARAAVGTGIARFPLDECARIMLAEVAAQAGHPSSLREVRFVLFGADAEAAFRQEANRQLMPAE